MTFRSRSSSLANSTLLVHHEHPNLISWTNFGISGMQIKQTIMVKIVTPTPNPIPRADRRGSGALSLLRLNLEVVRRSTVSVDLISSIFWIRAAEPFSVNGSTDGMSQRHWHVISTWIHNILFSGEKKYFTRYFDNDGNFFYHSEYTEILFNYLNHIQ